MPSETPGRSRTHKKGEKEKPAEPKGMSRRDFLRFTKKLMVGAAAAAVLGDVPVAKGQEAERIAVAETQPPARAATQSQSDYTEISEQEAIEVMNTLLEGTQPFVRELRYSLAITLRTEHWEIDARSAGASQMHMDIYAKTPDGRTQITSAIVTKDKFVILEIPSPETDLYGPGMLAIVDPMYTFIFYYDKTNNAFRYSAFDYDELGRSSEKPVVAAQIIDAEKAVNLLIHFPSSAQAATQERVTQMPPGSLIGKSSFFFDQEGTARPGPLICGETYIVT